MLESPRFAADMLEKEKGIVNSEINMITSNPDNIAYNKTLKNLFNIQTSSNDVIAGRTDNITNLTRDDVVKYFDTNYYPAPFLYGNFLRQLEDFMDVITFRVKFQGDGKLGHWVRSQ